MTSAIYEGTVYHRRHQPLAHGFGYRLFLLYLDLAELPAAFANSRLFGTSHWRPVRFCRADFLGPTHVPLDDAVRDLVEARLAWRPTGPIRMLTQLRFFGYGFNPVSFYYCFSANDLRVEAVVAEINNTPWNERYAYVLAPEPGKPCVFEMAKVFHVSPFFPMDMTYRWRFDPPGENLRIHMENHRQAQLHFEAGLRLKRHPMTAGNLRRMFCRYPLLSFKVSAGIYWQALKLKCKGVPFFDHPKHHESLEEHHENDSPRE